MVTDVLRKMVIKMVNCSVKGTIVSPRYRVAIYAYSSQVIDLLGGIKTITEIAQLGIPQLSISRTDNS